MICVPITLGIFFLFLLSCDHFNGLKQYILIHLSVDYTEKNSVIPCIPYLKIFVEFTYLQWFDFVSFIKDHFIVFLISFIIVIRLFLSFGGKFFRQINTVSSSLLFSLWLSWLRRRNCCSFSASQSWANIIWIWVVVYIIHGWRRRRRGGCWSK